MRRKICGVAGLFYFMQEPKFQCCRRERPVKGPLPYFTLMLKSGKFQSHGELNQRLFVNMVEADEKNCGVRKVLNDLEFYHNVQCHFWYLYMSGHRPIMIIL